jgi:hypothetical protein
MRRRRIANPRLTQLKPGDFLIYDYSNSRAHGCVYLGVDERGRAITADAGQPGIALHHCEVDDRGWGALLLRRRPLDFAVDLDSFEFEATPCAKF